MFLSCKNQLYLTLYLLQAARTMREIAMHQVNLSKPLGLVGNSSVMMTMFLDEKVNISINSNNLLEFIVEILQKKNNRCRKFSEINVNKLIYV
jgi:hypothetical protein